MKKFLKRNRFTCILVFIFALFVILGFKVKDILVPDEGKAAYGERLKNIDKHPISDEVYDKIDEELDKNSNVINSSHRIQGKIIIYSITVDEKVSVKDARSIGEGILKFFDEDALEYYTIRVIMSKENEELNNFPFIGEKHPKSNGLSWEKERDIVTESEQDEE